MNTKASEIISQLKQAGASRCLFVGGCVRDKVLGRRSKDIDIEVYGLSFGNIVDALSKKYSTKLVGQSFGILKVDNEFDISVPRRENKVGVGHKDFEVALDPNMSPYEAAMRRDFTMNSLAMDEEGNMIDFFNGQADIKHGILSATSFAFSEDPLRVLRGMQFSSRFRFRMDEKTIELCQDMVNQYCFLPIERIAEEWWKWATLSIKPSMGIKLLQYTGWHVHYPIIEQLEQNPQDPMWHPEGNSLIHTNCVTDFATEIADREQLDETQRAVLVLAAFCHDFGKPSTVTKNEYDRWIAPGHAEAGVPVATEFLKSIGVQNSVIEQVLPLVGEHMAHIGCDPTDRTVKRLALRLAPTNMKMWSWICESDHSGRPPLPPSNPVLNWMEIAARLELENNKPKPLVMGRHLLDLGYAPGPQMGIILKKAFEAQVDGAFDSIVDGINWIQSQS